MFKMKALAVALSTAVLATGSANAATILFSNITSTWQNTAGGSNVSVASGDSSKLSWGSNGTSSFSFDALNSVSFQNLPNPSASQTLGVFKHENDEITASSAITQTQLKISALVSVDGNGLGLKDFVFDVLHDETTNKTIFGYTYCCSDDVSIAPNNSGGVFSYAGIDYTLYLTGFAGSGALLSTPENDTKSAKLRGYIGAAPSAAVPEPATWAMMIGGLGLVGMTMRRRKTSVSFA